MDITRVELFFLYAIGQLRKRLEETKKREGRKEEEMGKGKKEKGKGIRENDKLTDDMEGRRTPSLPAWTRKRAAHNNSLLQWRGSVSS